MPTEIPEPKTQICAFEQEATNALSQIKASREALADLQDQLAGLRRDIAAATAQVAELKTDETKDILELGKLIAEQKNCIEVGELRAARLSKKIDEAKHKYDAWVSSANQLVKTSAMVLAEYRRQKRVDALSEEFSRWISESAASARAGGALFTVRKAISDLSHLDRSLVHLGGGGLPDKCTFGVMHGTLESNMNYLRAHAEEVAAAKEWKAADIQRLAAAAQRRVGPHDPLEDIHVYLR